MSDSANPSDLKPTGPFTIAEVAEVRSQLQSRLAQGGPVTLDLSSVERVDTAGLQLIVAAARTGRVAIEQTNEAVRKAAQDVGLQLPSLSAR